MFLKSCLKHLKNNAFVINKIWKQKKKQPWSDREGNRGGRDYIMHVKKIQSGGWEGYEWLRWTKDEGSGRPCPTLVSN